MTIENIQGNVCFPKYRNISTFYVGDTFNRGITVVTSISVTGNYRAEEKVIGLYPSNLRTPMFFCLKVL